MCGIVGWINNDSKLLNKKRVFKKMINTLKRRGPDDYGFNLSDNCLLGHRRLSVIDPLNGKQPMSFLNYTIVYNGEIYNYKELKKELMDLNYSFDTNCDTEVILKGYAHFGKKILDKLNGIFAFAIYDGENLFLARDRVGVKPLYFIKKNNDFLFSSNINAFFKSRVIDPVLDTNSISIIMGLLPSVVPGSGVFKDVFELLPGHYLIYKNNNYKIKKYWELRDCECSDSYEEAVEKVRVMVTDIIKRQMVTDVGVSTLLSGGLDSSIITAVCALNSNSQLKTYSIDYEDNNKYFKGNDYQVSQDNFYINIMKNKFNTIHSFKVIKIKSLIKYLKYAVCARDLPGMADIDSSLLWFSKKISKEQKVVLSGECADEIFGGYPWFYKKNLLEFDSFPWIRNLDQRQNLLNKNLDIDLKSFVNLEYKRYKKSDRTKNLFYLNMNYFMTTLLNRKDRMTMYASLEARVPFADHELIEYLWNLPFEYKYKDGVEKKLLRDAFSDILPNEIVNRKKNPYPKTHHPLYYKIMKKRILKILGDKKSIIHKIFDLNELKKLVFSEDVEVPWFGQLMTGPQLLAYIYQIHYWGKKYQIKIVL